MYAIIVITQSALYRKLQYTTLSHHKSKKAARKALRKVKCHFKAEIVKL